eukprot:CAMPEP_0119532604 /NCGR_PEP_ID=MMETSP1344-20130328/46098_1 /TAXON_ID=236787 /ORGANISM="Florenciella parvula, Strain CCMP2471" /LENGTH=107 /DNA_ID=CAMNT_0007573167 /DNA_START=355 /DNA_END=678 /DNA_ORIENTATION=-
MCPPSRRKSTPSSGTRCANQGQSPVVWLSVTSRARRGRAGGDSVPTKSWPKYMAKASSSAGSRSKRVRICQRKRELMREPRGGKFYMWQLAPRSKQPAGHLRGSERQ